MEELDDTINMPRQNMRAQEILFVCDVTNKSVTTSTKKGKLAYKLWFGTSHILATVWGGKICATERARTQDGAKRGKYAFTRITTRNSPVARSACY